MIHVDIQAVDELAADVGQFKDIDAVDAAGFVEKTIDPVRRRRRRDK